MPVRRGVEGGSGRRGALAISVCLLALAVVSALAGSGAAAGAETPAYLNTQLSPAERAADLISRMTLQEKAAQLSTTNAPAIPRLGVQEYAYWSEALHGVNAFWGGDSTSSIGVDINNVKATSFPSPLAASLAWDPALMHREAGAISDEARGFLDPSLFGKSQNNLGPDAREVRQPLLLLADGEHGSRPALGARRRDLRRGPVPHGLARRRVGRRLPGAERDGDARAAAT